MIQRVVVAATALLIVAAPLAARAQILGPVPVVETNPTTLTEWATTTLKDIATAAQTYSIMNSEIEQLKNLVPTAIAWLHNTTHDPLNQLPVLQAGVATAETNIAAVEAETGAAQPANIAYNLANNEMAQVPVEQADLTTAETASDDAEGNLAVQQAGHRLQEMQVANEQKIREMMYAQQIQRTADEEDALAWMNEGNQLAAAP
jgi:hypothetical protein